MSVSASESKAGGTRKRGSSSSKQPELASLSQGEQRGTFVCPECGKRFSRAQALGAHRSRTHGVARTSRAARPSGGAKRDAAKRDAAKAGTATARGRSSGRTRASGGPPSRDGHFDRDNVLAAVFPNGVPPQASVIAALAPWLDEAERLSRMR